jgi:hypothetical protein
MRSAILAALLLAVAITSRASDAGHQTLAVRLVSPFGIAPATLTLMTIVEPDANNVALEIVVESEDYYTRSVIEWPGEHAPRARQAKFRGLRPGNYDIRVAVFGTNGIRSRADAVYIVEP